MSMKLLLHVCCGPCTIYPLKYLRREGFEPTGHFYNPNIHPYKEFSKRLATLEAYAKQSRLPLIVEKKYGLTEFIRNVVFKEKDRCSYCYSSRLEETARLAKERGFEIFSTTLLYSRYQNHQVIQSLGESLAKKYSLGFLYHDFREGWQAGIEASKDQNMYRQPYCGCIYSEQERYDKSLRKKRSC